MFTNRDDDPSQVGVMTRFPRCSLPELYALAEQVDKESRKSNHLKTLGLSLTEAWEILTRSLTSMSPTGRMDLGEDSQFVPKHEEVGDQEEKLPPSLTDLLHRSLLSGSPSQVNRLGQSKQILAQYGIPPPMHAFPYEFILSDTNLSERKRLSSSAKGGRLSISKLKAEKFLFEDRITEYEITEPGTPNTVGGRRVESLLENLPPSLELKVSNIGSMGRSEFGCSANL